MTAARTTTVHTLDHGPVTLTCPTWCADVHAPQNGGYRADIVHTGPEIPFTVGDELLFIAQYVSYPYAERLPRTTGLYVEQSGYARTLDPAGLDQLAAALVEHATRLRHLARQLSALEVTS
jgi:hypothetical protein